MGGNEWRNTITRQCKLSQTHNKSKNDAFKFVTTHYQYTKHS